MKSSTPAVKLAVPAALIALALLVACGRDVRMAGQTLRDVRVHAVEHNGVRLDEHATPEQVASAMLTALGDDLLASSRSQRDQAVDVQLDLCAAASLAARRPAVYSRPEWLFRVVSGWAPVVSQYKDSILEVVKNPSSRLTSARLPASGKSGRDVCDVFVRLDDATDARASVVLRIRMHQEAPEEGDASADARYWRVYSLSFQAGARTVPPAARTG